MVRKAGVLKLRFFGTLAGALLLASMAAHAVPVELAFSGTVAGSDVTGATIGDAITLDIFANNGGTSLISQTWTVTDITSTTMHAGTYSAAASGAQLGGFGSFSTNASGQLQTLDFTSSQNGTDTNGNSAFTNQMNGSPLIWFTASLGGGGDFIEARSGPTIANTTISLVSTPLPATLPLFATGLGALGLLGWRRKRKAQAIA